VTLTALQFELDNQAIDFSNQWFFQQLEQKTGVHVDFEEVKEIGWDSKLNLMFASGSLTDLILRGSLDVEEYGVSQHLLVPLEELIPEEMPNYAALLNIDDAGASIPSSDGHSYYVGFLISQGVNTNGHFFINQTWLDKLGLAVPTTVDELTDVSLSVDRGGVVGLLGRNGAGKSTLMNLLTGYIGPTEGGVTLDGVSLLADPARVKSRIGYLPEVPPLYGDMTVEEQLRFAAAVKRIPPARRSGEIAGALARVEPADHRKRLVRHLSKGYRQRVGLAQALPGEPDVLILDEPSAGLDPTQIAQMRSVIRDYSAAHAVIVSSHILGEIGDLCEDLIVPDQGRVIKQDKLEKLLSDGSGALMLRYPESGGIAEALAALCFLVALNLGLEAADGAACLRLDLSPDQVTALSDRSVAALAGLTDTVTFIVARGAGAQSELGDLLDELLAKYVAQSPYVSVRVVDPDARPYVFSALDKSGEAVTDNTVYLSNADGSRVRRVGSDQLIYERQPDGETCRLFCGDARFAGALEMLSSDAVHRAVFLSGHGESTDATTLALTLTSLDCDTETLTLPDADPTAADTLIVLAPQTDLTAAETDALAEFLDSGGKLLIAYGADTDQSKLKQFATLLSLYGLDFEPGTTVETASDGYIDRPDHLVPALGDAELLADIDQRLILPAACAMASPSRRGNVSAETLLTTSDKAYRKLADGDLYTFETGDASGRQILALSAETSAGARIVQLASVAALTDGADVLDASANLAFASACVGWLSGEDSAAGSADLKVLPNNLIVFADDTQENRVMVWSVAALPAAIAPAGMIALLIRRRRVC
jgi:ABC-2 type transport system ATP-binding protein